MRRVIGPLALAGAILLLSLGAAQAQTATTTTLVASAPGSSTLPQPVTFTATADYYFSRDDAQTAGLTIVPLLQRWSARLTGGVAATLPSGASLGAGGEFGGIGSANHIWTWTGRGRIPF